MSNTWEESSSLKILSSQIIEISDAVAIRPWRVSTTLKGGHFITSSLFPILSVSSMLIVCQSLNTNRMVASRKVCLHRLICQTSANCPIPFISDTSLFLHLDEWQSWLYMNNKYESTLKHRHSYSQHSICVTCASENTIGPWLSFYFRFRCLNDCVSRKLLCSRRRDLRHVQQIHGFLCCSIRHYQVKPF